MNNIPSLFKARSANSILLICALWLTFFSNASYYQHVLAIYDITLDKVLFLGSIVLLQLGFVSLLLSILSFKFLFKTALVFILMSAAAAAYFMDVYSIVIDVDMIRNAMETNTQEALDLVTFKFAVYLFFLGLLPSIWVIKTPVKWNNFIKESLSRIKLIVLSCLIIVLCIGLFYKPYAYFFREHKPVRFYSNPVYPVYSLLKYAFKDISSSSNKFSQLGLDASIPAKDQDRELIIMVVGETARADHFSLNGYSRKTNPLLEQESLFNFTKMTSCGTSTAISVPCMFSFLTQQDFSNNEANQTENILDILTRAGVNVLWRDNNSSSKGVADRITFQDFRRPDNNPICDIECRDEGLLSGLQEYIDTQKEGDILIVLHQMGNHGPAYYKRYTKEFEVFKPACQTAQLEDCNQQEIHNAYDNAILYTDYFLSKAIQLLKQNSTIFETGLFYASDHGESLGEKGIYLHGLPNIIAPNAQTQVPAFLWLGQSYKIPSIQAIRQKTRSSITHDHIFHSLLGLFEVDSAIYNEKLDILSETD